MSKFQWERRTKVLAISFFAAAFTVTGGLAVQGHIRAENYRNYINSSYQHAFAELTTAMSEIDTALQKSAYATSPSLLSSLCTELFGRAMSAQMAIGELPYGNVELEQTAAFVAKVGDYAVALSKNSAVNGGCTEEERNTLRALSAASGSLSQLLQDLEADIYAGSMTLESLEGAQERLSAATEDAQAELGGSTFQTVESDFPEIPSLIYDGPFSEHIASRTPKFLEGKEDVSQETAQAALADFLGLKSEIFSLTSAGEGRIPTWGFSAAVDGGELYAEVTRQGGLVISLMNSRPVGTTTISATEAVQLGADFLRAQGYSDMTPSYFINENNVLIINFAAQQNGVFCYPDLIKVSIALDNGRVVGFEANGYFMNHTARELPQGTVSLAQAQAVLDPGLKILSQQMALIPTGGENEVLCYEFKCELEDSRHYIVYVNAQTGNEEKILILIENENGTLTI